MSWASRPRFAHLLAALMVLSAVAPVAMADDVATVDADHALAGEDAPERFEKEGIVSDQLTVPAMSITVAEDHDDVGLDGIRLDGDKVYLRLQYNETVPRTVRVYIPSEYWYPITAMDKEAANTDQTADFEPSPSGRYTAVTAHFDGKTDAVFEVPLATSGVFWFRSTTRKAVKNTTGYDPPRLGSGGKWEYVSDGALDGNASYPVNASAGATVQYDADETPGQETWLSVPDCGGNEDAPVCLYQKRNEPDKEYVLSKTADAPSVRWKAGADLSAEAKSGWTDLQLIPERVRAFVDNLFGNGAA